MSQPDDAHLLRDMLGHAQLACRAARGRSRADLTSDRMFQVTCKRFIESVGEAAANVSDEFKNTHADIPWRRIVGTRNVLVHGYAQIDLDILWDIVDVNLPDLITQLEKALAE